MPRESFSASSSHGSDRLHVEWGRGQVSLANEGDSDEPGFPGRVTLRSPFNNPEGLDQFIDTLVRARLEAFGRPQARAIVVEVIEESRATDDTLPGSVIIPSDVRINGQSVLTEGGVKIDSIDVPPRAVATVTMTMPVRRVTIAAEGDL